MSRIIPSVVYKHCNPPPSLLLCLKSLFHVCLFKPGRMEVRRFHLVCAYTHQVRRTSHAMQWGCFHSADYTTLAWCVVRHSNAGEIRHDLACVNYSRSKKTSLLCQWSRSVKQNVSRLQFVENNAVMWCFWSFVVMFHFLNICESFMCKT